MARILATVAARICDSDSYGVVSARTSGDEEWPKVCVTVGTARLIVSTTTSARGC